MCRYWSCPWRSLGLPRAVAVVALLGGLPLFLRMPLWCDLTLYDVVVRNLLRGGLHYRDTFDTNLPGFVWLLSAIRSVFGFGAFALRCVDLLVVTGIVVLLDRLARRGGATAAARWWAIAGVCLLYPFAVEMVHCQRDTWMALPALAAVLLRVRRVGSPGRRPFAAAVTEGALWGVAVWIKPHVVLMAVGVWAFSARRLAAAYPKPWAGLAADLLGNLAGGLAVGLAGLAYLFASGTWPYFWEVMTVWAPEYAGLAGRELDWRLEQECHWFPPWSLWTVPTLVLALITLLDAAPWGGQPDTDPDDPKPGPIGRLLPGLLWDLRAGPNARFVRGTLAALWLLWAFQSLYIQRGFNYVHMPETLIMLGLWASHRWCLPFVVFVWLALTSTLWVLADTHPGLRASLLTLAEHDGRSDGDDPDKERYLVRHPLADLDRMRHWPECFRWDLSDPERYALWDRLKRIQDHEASPGWVELAEVAAFLRSKQVRDGELIAWHDSPHVLYLMMDLRPGLRYLHVNTAIMISPRAHSQVLDELYRTAGTARYAVSDLGWAALGQKPEVKAAVLGPGPGPGELLGPALDRHRRTFPFNQKAVFRSGNGRGRYVVHELVPPLGDG